MFPGQGPAGLVRVAGRVMLPAPGEHRIRSGPAAVERRPLQEEVPGLEVRKSEHHELEIGDAIAIDVA